MFFVTIVNIYVVTIFKYTIFSYRVSHPYNQKGTNILHTTVHKHTFISI